MSPEPALTPTPQLPVRWVDLGDVAALGGALEAPVVAVGVPVVAGDDGPVLAPGIPERIDLGGGQPPLATGLDPEHAAQRGFTGKVGQSLVVSGPAATPVVVFLGTGAADGGADVVRRAAAELVRSAGRGGTALLVLAPAPDGEQRTVQAAAEGAILAAYRFVTHKSSDDRRGVERLVVGGWGFDPAAAQAGVRRGVAVGRAVLLARDLVNEPPSSMTPARLAAVAEAHVAGRPGVRVEVWDEERIAAEHLGGLLGVARGSAEPPRLIRAEYVPSDPLEIDGRVPHVVLVGKGITFDSGGLSLKTPEGMTTMKTDMSGAAAVLGAVSACGELGVRIKVTAIAPATENMPGGRATKPGDVLTIRNGLTIEVLNTDAEGRLVLADGLSLAGELDPDAVIDLATLTGACVTALGMSVAGLFGTDDALVSSVRDASERAGEATWPLPLVEDYRCHIDSEVADMKNVGKGGQAGAIAAALLLARFVEGIPWVHLDIAGPARSDEDGGILAKGGTGFGVRTLLELLGAYGA